MSQIILQTQADPQTTVVSNRFIDEYLPRANGEFVKVYLTLLRTLVSAEAAFDPERMADHLLCTEKDILRALRYWEEQGLLMLSFGADQSLRSVTFTGTGSGLQKSSVSPAPAPAAAKPAEPVVKKTLSLDRIMELKSDESITMLLYSAERYLGKTLSATEMQKILYFYDVLKMSPELIEFLIEHCVSHNHKSIHYIEAVALAWSKEGIRTVPEAKEASSRHNRDYYAILKAMGITNRSPVEEETGFMRTWLQDYGFDLTVIQEACSRTVIQTGQPSFPYADKILADWKSSQVRTVADVKQLDETFRQAKKAKAAARRQAQTERSTSRPQTNNRFNNFHQRDYDTSDYNKLLLGQMAAAPKDPR